jgi:hypothetical protein
MYRCAECNLAVIVADGQIIRACPHPDAAVIAEASSVLKGAGGVRA